MDGENKGPGALTGNLTTLGNQVHIPTSLQNMLGHPCMPKTVETDDQELLSHLQDMLEQLGSRGYHSVLISVSPLGEASVHATHKGQVFLKENPDIVERLSKLCSDDVWSVIGNQKRFFELSRVIPTKPQISYSDKGDYPLDFSHERGSYFPAQQHATENRQNSQEASFIQGILNQGSNQNKGYQTNNSFLNGSFGSYMTENRSNYANGSFFHGGFTQNVPGSESYPQPSFMSGMDVPVNSNLGSNPISVQNSVIPTPQPSTHHKNSTLSQSEDDIIKEMLTSAPLADVFKDSTQRMKIEKGKEDAISMKKDLLDKKKRERRPDTWQRNIKKKLKTEGKAYINARGKLVPAKSMRPVDCTNCKQKCTEKISEETRQKIFDWFWRLGSYTAQKEFVVSRVTQVQTKTSKRRHVHRLFSFDINGKYESVCKPFFSRTLGIGDSYIYKAFEQKARDLFVQDGRGKHAPVNKTSEEQIEFMHQHLNHCLSSYPTDRPLPKNIHAVKWYDDYTKLCSDRGQKPVSKHIYRRIFQEFVRRYPPNPAIKKKASESNESAGESSSN